MTAQTDRARRSFVLEEAVAILARTPATRVLARQYPDEVGPWRVYLRIISGTQG